MNQNKIVENIFPTPITIIQEIGLDVKFFSDLIIKNLDKERLSRLELLGITTTDDNLHLLDTFAPLVNKIHNESALFFESYLGLNKDDLCLTGMWSNVQKSGAQHPSHQHPNSFYSGVVYLSIPPSDSGQLYFIDPRPAKNMAQANYQISNCLSDRSVRYTPITGTMLLFPSWLEHGTEVFLGNPTDKRISLSFNYALKKSNNFTMKLDFN